MITVLRRWFVPAAGLQGFAERWQNDILPVIRSQPGFIRIEVYESSIREHWVTAVTWENEGYRQQALEALAGYRSEFSHYERFEPEVLKLRFRA